MYFRKADAAPAGTRGRGLDHIGFEVKNLEDFCKKLEAAGQKFDRPVRAPPELDDGDCVSDRPVGHVYRADGEPGALEVRDGPVRSTTPANTSRLLQALTATQIAKTAIGVVGIRPLRRVLRSSGSALTLPLEFPGFSGDFVHVVSVLPRIALG